MVEEPNHLTVLDMLDVLEAEIGLLRGQYQTLAAALSNTRDQNNAQRSSKPRAKRARARKPKRKIAKRLRNGTGRSAPIAQGDPAKEERALGKRQALGKSLLQLRRIPAAPQSEPSDNVDDKQDVFHSS